MPKETGYKPAEEIAERMTARRMPDEIVAWPSDVTQPGETALTGAWSARRHYTDEAVTYVRKDTSN